MNKINFNQFGGFPLTTNVLHEMQETYKIFNSLGALAGNKTIISGCEQVGNTVANGVVYIDGEVLEFEGGTAISTVKIFETVDNLVFENNVSNPTIYKRYVGFGSGVGAMDWADFKRGFETKNIDTLLARIEALEARPMSNIPVGMIAIWDRPANLIPVGWEEYLPLRGRSAVGHDPNYNSNTNQDTVNYGLNSLGSAGGVTEHKLTMGQMPKHKFRVYGTDNSAQQLTNNGEVANLQNSSVNFVETNELGNDEKHTNMSPYRVVHYIQYKG